MHRNRFPLATQLLRAATVAALSVPLLEAAPIPVSGTDSYAQDFNSLDATGTDITWTDDSTIEGWYSNRLTYSASDGSSTSGSLYSYGVDEVKERALGDQGSGSTDTIYFGVLFQNTSDSDVEIDLISFTGEQWRYSGTAAAQSMDFAFQTSAEPIVDLSSGIWQGVPALTFTSPIISGESAGPLDGNDETNQAALTSPVQIIIPPGEYAMLRWEDVNHSGNDHGLAVDDLTVGWKPSTGVDTVDPLVTELSPPNNAVSLLVESVTELTVDFNEIVDYGTGNIVIRDASNMAAVLTINAAAQEDFFIFDNQGFIPIPDPSPFQAGESYYVEIPSGAITDPAGNPFAGFDSTGWTFSFAGEATPPVVVVNKYANNTDTVELLVIGDQTPGSTVDMRGMILKDFSSSMENDGGGKFELTMETLWSAVPVGTLVTFIDGSDSSSDIDPSDFTLSFGLADSLYLTPVGDGTFNIANTEMVMIKEAGSAPEGTLGGIHALAGGAPGALFTNYPGFKLLAPLGGTGVVALNSNSSLDDFDGEDAEGGVSLSPGSFGIPNNGTNSGYIATLRGLIPGDGDGVADLVNTTAASPFTGIAMFDKGQTGQTATLSLSASIPGVTLSDAVIVVPAEMGTPAPGGTSLSGTGSTGANLAVVDQTITISSAAITDSDSLVVEIDGLTTPTPVTGNGNYEFTTSTSTSGGTLTVIGQSPNAHVIVPIASVRGTDANGVAADLGTIVAVEGVSTEEDFGSGGAFYSGFIQDSTAGINIFSRVDDPVLTRGNRFAAVGALTQFNGLTEIELSSGSNIVDLGADTEPASVTVSLPDLLAAPEDYEGSLITVAGLSKSESENDSWGAGMTITVVDASMNTLDIRIQSGSTALTEPFYPATITGIFGQYDTSTPYTGGYQLMPRDDNDLAGASGDAYTSWASFNGLTAGVNDGPEDDVENNGVGDGIANVLEFILNGDPLADDLSILPVASVDETDFIFTFKRLEESIGVATATFQWATDVNFPGGNDVAIGELDSGPDGNGVTVDVDETTSPDTITVRVPRSNADKGTIQGRLMGTKP